MIKISVLQADPSTKGIWELDASKIATQYSKGEKLEFTSSKDKIGFSGLFQNQYMGALHESFSNHYDFVLDPNDIWLLILQNLSAHINQNSEKFRNVMVDFSGKKNITVDHDALVMGSEDNTWDLVFPLFEKKISELIKDPNIAKNIVPTFSNSTPIDKNCFRIALMDICKSYFSYTVRTRCGIPNIFIAGEREDWVKIIESINFLLPKFELSDWCSEMTTILNKIVSTFDGDIDSKFFGSIYKHDSMSGSSKASGWITDFFIYIIDDSHNVVRKVNSVVETSDFISSLSSVPFNWNYYGVNHDMNFYSGVCGFELVDGMIKTKKNFFITHKNKIT